MSGASPVGTRLRRDWTLAAVGAVVALFAAVLGMAWLADHPVAARWALPAAGVVAFELWFLRRNLEANHADEEGTATAADRRNSRLGLANAVTLFRGGLFAGVAGFVAIPPAPVYGWLPALLYGAGCALDAVDGVLARYRRRTTVLGARLDMAFDTLGFLVAPVVAVVWGRLPVWYLSLSLARYLFKAGRGWRRRRGLPVFELPFSRLRRPLAGVQMGFIAFALTPLLLGSAIEPVAAVVLAPSLAVFLRDYLVVSGRLGGDE
ncbi:CDP-alcohol phosphatidyltransferase family protein [Halolamina sp.]|uniref:CDP-alcohol phosphatidyltransferase family protein n=1 Tax=Halolamina sp. TaxID=1940283 RepID=UPI003565EAC3